MWLARVAKGWPQTLVAALFAISNVTLGLALDQQCQRPRFWEVECCIYNECPVAGEFSECAKLQRGCTLFGDLSTTELDASFVTCTNAKPASRPVCEITNFPMERVVGYYDGAAARRPCQPMTPFALPRGVYTHLNFAFATIDPKTFEVLLSHKWDYILYRDMVALKKFDGNLKVFLSIGGWNHADEHGDATSVMTIFSQLAASEKYQKRFFKSLVSLMNAFAFDGVDIHWPYPGQNQRGGQAQDFETLPRFIGNLKRHLDKKSPERNGLSVAVPLQTDTLKHFDMLKLQPNVDFFNMLSFTSDDKIDGRKTLTLKPHTDLRETKASLDLLWEQGLDSTKITLGVSFQAKTAVLEDDGCTSPGCPSRGPGAAELCSNTFGSMLRAEPEIGHLLSSTSDTAHLDKEYGVKYTTKDTNWLSYEDSETWQLKTNLARSQCLGGIMVWALGDEDERGQLSKKLQKLTGYHSHHPLMHDNQENLSELKRLSAAARISENRGRGAKVLDKEDAGTNTLICRGFTAHDLSASVQEVLCKAYPKRSLRKVCSAPNHPQVPGGYSTPYGSKRVQHPGGTQPARNTTTRCGRWHIATEEDTGKALLQIYGLDVSLLFGANPSINEHNIQEPLDAGKAYCVAPVEGYHLDYRDIGCYYNINREVMPVLGYTTTEDPNMTVDKCAKICMSGIKFPYFGLKNGRVCMCGYGVHYETTKVKDKYCNKPCGGDVAMMCGGKKYTRLYSSQDELRVVSSPKNDRPQFGRGFGGTGGGCGGGMKNAWGGPGV